MTVPVEPPDSGRTDPERPEAMHEIFANQRIFRRTFAPSNSKLRFVRNLEVAFDPGCFGGDAHLILWMLTPMQDQLHRLCLRTIQDHRNHIEMPLACFEMIWHYRSKLKVLELPCMHTPGDLQPYILSLTRSRPRSLERLVVAHFDGIQDIDVFEIFEPLVTNRPLLRHIDIKTSVKYLSDMRRFGDRPNTYATLEDADVAPLRRLHLNSCAVGPVSTSTKPRLDGSILQSLQHVRCHDTLEPLESAAELNHSGGASLRPTTLDLVLEQQLGRQHSLDSVSKCLQSFKELQHLMVKAIGFPPHRIIDVGPICHHSETLRIFMCNCITSIARGGVMKWTWPRTEFDSILLHCQSLTSFYLDYDALGQWELPAGDTFMHNLLSAPCPCRVYFNEDFLEAEPPDEPIEMPLGREWRLRKRSEEGNSLFLENDHRSLVTDHTFCWERLQEAS